MSKLGDFTGLCRYTNDEIFVREKNLCTELIGKTTFSEFLFLLIIGHRPSPKELAIVDAAMVSLAEHGMTPSAVAARLTYMGAPESLQGAVAAGILGCGDQFVGTLELTGPLLIEMVNNPEGLDAAAKKIVARYTARGELIPGFGQPHHKPDDPRPPALFLVAEEAGVKGDYIRAIKVLGLYVDEAIGRHMTINAPGAIAALFLEINLPVSILRGFVVICRAAGIVAHVHEEQKIPVGRTLWKVSEAAVAYDSDAGVPDA